jgi:2-keto-4-pentenoate hydratase
VAQVAPGAESFEERLARCRVTLWRGNEMVEAGVGANVLDGPLHALQHLVRARRDCPGATELRAGDVVTRTWTDTWPMERAIRLATFHARSHLRLREKPCNTDSSARAI